MAKQDYYELLGVPKTATADEIKKAFRKLAYELHPDRNPDNKEAEDRLKTAAEAYSVLSNAEKRQMYDRFGAEGARAAGFGGFQGDADIFSSFGDLFEEIFGGFGGGGFQGARGGRSRARRGADLRLDIELTFEEAAKGATKEFEITKAVSCEVCDGSGAKKGTEPAVCPTCAGRGMVSHSQGLFAFSTACPRCHGEGRIVKDPCETCRGAGNVRKKKKLKIEIPAGVDENNRVQIAGEGESGERGGPPGDLFLVIHLKEHEIFTRDGDALLCRVPITFAQAALGATIPVPSIDGEKLEIEIHAGTQSGETFTIPRAGFPRPGRGTRGDEIVQVYVVTPKKLSARQKELLRELAEIEGPAEAPGDDGLIGKFKKKFKGR